MLETSTVHVFRSTANLLRSTANRFRSTANLFRSTVSLSRSTVHGFRSMANQNRPLGSRPPVPLVPSPAPWPDAGAGTPLLTDLPIAAVPGTTASDPHPAAAGDPVRPPSPKAGPFPEVLRRFESDLTALLAPLHSRAPYVPSGPARKWRGYMPTLARACADALDSAAGLFADFPLSGQHVRELEGEVRKLGIYLLFLQRATKRVSALHQSRKQELADKTLQIADQLHALARMPALPADLRTQARTAAAPLDAVLHKNNAKVQHTRKERARMRKEAEAKTQSASRELHAAELEGHVLRGGSLTRQVLAQGV